MLNAAGNLAAPFPYFGGKVGAVETVWQAFGDVANYVEPFAGSAAMLLGSPDAKRVETINDFDGFVANFWRAISHDPEMVAHHADWPCNECVPAGTLISTPGGGVPIEYIKPGMIVLGESNGEVVETIVLAAKQSEASEFYVVGPLRLTGNHPVWTKEHGYLDASNLASGMTILAIDWPNNKPQAEIIRGCDSCADFVRGNGGGVSIDHRCRECAGGERSLCVPSCAQGMPLQRESLQTPVAVYNFQTETGNYFAEKILVHNCDLFARHGWLVRQATDLKTKMETDPDYYDAKIAGWWCWGACNWIGSGWCSGDGPWVLHDGKMVKGNAGQGINRKLPHLGNAGQGINRKLPHLGDAGRGINRQLPHLGNAGQGINRQLPHLSAGRGINRQTEQPRRAYIIEWFGKLHDRLRDVRVACGDWQRVCKDSVTTRHGLTALFLDPPYAKGAMDYGAGGMGLGIAEAVQAWCKANGDNPQLRIVLCGHAGEHDALLASGWSVRKWTARKGYALTDEAVANSASETIWCSPHCVPEIVTQSGLF